MGCSREWLNLHCHAHVHARDSSGFAVACWSRTQPRRGTSRCLATLRNSTMNDNDACWPGGKRIAVLVSILFECWSDGKGPSYFPRTTPLKPGTVDRGAIQWAQYAGNEGLWRILRTLDCNGVPATIFCSGRARLPYPHATR